MRKPSPRRGVTLLELLVVLVVLGIGAALVTPALRTPNSTDTTTDAFTTARRDAARRGETQHVTQDGNTWDVTPAGLCLPNQVQTTDMAWDPVRCEAVPQHNTAR
jgi:prepilin-type N-terminal cleavage/methylation domain-containing protein